MCLLFYDKQTPLAPRVNTTFNLFKTRFRTFPTLLKGKNYLNIFQLWGWKNYGLRKTSETYEILISQKILLVSKLLNYYTENVK